jgi:hypothetical protein
VKAVSSERKHLPAQQPQLPRGRPRTKAAKQAARTKKRLTAQRAALFASRYLFVQRHLNKTERKTLWRVSRGLPQLQALRAIMEQVYALFDRRCRTQTALDKLATLRRRVQRFKVLGDTLKKLFSPTLEKALTFLDDKLLPSTSNAVERGNRRYRKMDQRAHSKSGKPERLPSPVPPRSGRARFRHPAPQYSSFATLWTQCARSGSWEADNALQGVQSGPRACRVVATTG